MQYKKNKSKKDYEVLINAGIEPATFSDLYLCKDTMDCKGSVITTTPVDQTYHSAGKIAY